MSGLPDDANVLNTLGIAQYRAGLLQESLETLRRAGELGTDPLNLVFEAMIHHRRGNAERATEALVQARRGILRNGGNPGIDTLMYLAEAEGLLGGDGDSGR